MSRLDRAVCVLDPDSDIVPQLQASGANRDLGRACYHSDLSGSSSAAAHTALCIVWSGPHVVGPDHRATAAPHFVLIEKVLRTEGTSSYGLSPSEFSQADAHLPEGIAEGLSGVGEAVERGAP